MRVSGFWLDIKLVLKPTQYSSFRRWENINLSVCFKGHFLDESGLADTGMSSVWILLELRMMEVVSGDN